MNNGSSAGLEARADHMRQSVPRFWWAWVALEVATFVVAPLLIPDPPGSWVPWAFWAAVAALVAWRMLRHSKLAWLIAVGLSIWGLIGGLMLIAVIFGDGEDALWFAWGLVDAILSLLILFSPEARAWVEPARPEPVVPR